MFVSFEKQGVPSVYDRRDQFSSIRERFFLSSVLSIVWLSSSRQHGQLYPLLKPHLPQSFTVR